MSVRYELLLRFNEQTGVLKGAAARYANGSLMPITPETLGDWLPDALTDALAANQTLTAEVAALTTERDTAAADLVTRTAERDALQAQIDAAATSAARIPVSAFVRRFPGAAMDAVNAAAATDATVAAILAQLDAVQTVRLGHPTTTQGVGYLVSVGLLTQAQADVVLHYDVPQVP